MIVSAPPGYLTTPEFAVAVGRSKITIQQWVTRGVVQAERRAGPGKQPYFIPESEVARFNVRTPVVPKV